MEMIRTYVPGLIGEGLRRRSFLLLDAAIEQLIPPFSVLAGLSVVSLLGALLLRSRQAIRLAAAIIGGQAAYVFAGLALSRAPLALYRALIFTPAFLVWKIILYVRLLLGIKPDNWVRTARNSR